MKYYTEEQLIEFGRLAMILFSPNDKVNTHNQQEELWNSASTKILLPIPEPKLVVPDENPFLKLSSDTIQELLVAIRKNFLTETLYGDVVQDYSKHFILYNELLKYTASNYDTLKLTHSFQSNNSTYGEMVVTMLNDYGIKALVNENAKK